MASQGKVVMTHDFTLLIVNVYTAFEYELNHGAKTLQPFFDTSLPMIRHPEVKSWSEDLSREREHLQSVTGVPSSQ